MRTAAATTIVAIASSIAAPHPARAQEEWQSQIRAYLDRVSAPAVGNGFSALGQELTGSLAAGESGSIDVNLNAGVDYSLIGVCDADCGDINLEIYDSEGHEIDSDLESDDVPIVTLTPDRSASYRLVIGMVTCKLEPCYYGVRLLKRPAIEPDEHEQLVRQQLEAFGARLAGQSYQRTHGYRMNALDQAANYEFTIRLKAGTTYAIAGFCDHDCSDLDLALFTDGPEPIVQDVEDDDHPAFNVEVTSTGSFRIRVSMASCSNQPCILGVGVYGTPTGAGTPGLDDESLMPERHRNLPVTSVRAH